MNDKLNLLTEGIILVLILTDIILLTSIFFINVSPNVYKLIIYFDLFVVLILIPEFLYRFGQSNDKKSLFENWTDIIGMIQEIIVGPVSTFFRYFCLIRIIKILALFKKEIRNFFEFLHKTRIDYGLLLILITLISSATIFFLIEFGTNQNINSFDDSFWYLLST